MALHTVRARELMVIDRYGIFEVWSITGASFCDTLWFDIFVD
jgi:hypothetical protein